MKTTDKVAQASKTLERLSKELTKRNEALTAARATEADAISAFDQDNSDANVDAASKARIRREQAERFVGSVGAEHATAQQTLATLERQAQIETLDQEKGALARWPLAMRSHIERIVALDRELDAAILGIASQINEANQLRMQAVDRADALGFGAFGIVQPSMASARLLAQRALRDVRKKEERADASAWLESASSDLRFDGLDADELEDVSRFIANARAQDAEVATALRIASSLVPTKTNITPTETVTSNQES